MGRRGCRAWLAIAFAALTVGCGGGDSDEDQVRDVVNSFVQAGKDRDPAEACSLLASDQLQLVERAGGGADCERVLGGLFAKPDAAATDLQIEAVRVQGDRATVDVSVKSGGSTAQAEGILLVREGDGWKIASAGP